MSETTEKLKRAYNKNYKLLLLIPIILLLISLAYIGYFYSKEGDFIKKDVSLTGGTIITLNENVNFENLESELKNQFSDVSIRKLTDIRTGRQISLTIETSAKPDEIKPVIEKILGYKLTNENSSIEFTGASLSNSFYKQLIIALIISFILMSCTVFLLFKTFVPSIAIIFSIFADIIMPLALIDYLGIRISAAGIAAFLMLIGYSVDTDILLTTRALRKKEGSLNIRLFGAFKTGIFMTTTALIAIIPAFFIVSLPDSFKQIFLILALGLSADIINTWLTNMSIIKWYCERRNIQ